MPPPPAFDPWAAAPVEAVDDSYSLYPDPVDELAHAAVTDRPPAPAEAPDESYGPYADPVDRQVHAAVTDRPPAPVEPPVEAADEAADESYSLYADPVDGLVHAAVADRPLDEVIQLIQLLEQSPEYARATVDALRAVGTDRSVEDVTRLVTLLTQPPRNPDSADEAIRAAAEARPVEEVTRLMELLHRHPLEPHCGEAAVRAAATSRPVEELVQLIGRMAQEQGVRVERQQAEAARPTADGPGDLSPEVGTLAEGGAVKNDRVVAYDRSARARRDRAARGGSAPAWPRLIAAVALVVCGLAHFPPHRDGASLNAYACALGASGMCVLLGLALFRRSRLPVLVLSVVVSAALTVAQLVEGRFHSPGLSRALDIAAAPPWLAGLAAVLAALAALTALLAFLSSDKLGPPPEIRQMAGSHQAPD
ncbi:hypothetical protein [Streptomyces albicerus]|uniref:hypothetical protein n=1 Tax=Streptomyces albicerus TaxID=2569859 RepID=UPI001CECF3B8|nr:hypothetical protein [Streptomyces albicerus]